MNDIIKREDTRKPQWLIADETVEMEKIKML